MLQIVDILILGAGWSSTFLVPLCKDQSVTYAATTRDGRDGTIKFEFNQELDDPEPYRALPHAKSVIITFPITKVGGSERLVRLYSQTREGRPLTREARFIQLGSTGIWDGQRKGANPSRETSKPVQSRWYDRHTPFVPNDRGKAEEELLALSPQFKTTVLNLVGLWGGTRLPKNWVERVAPTKEALRGKGSLHVIHGLDVACAILAVHKNFEKAQGQRWILSDGRVYDWWDLASAWGIQPKLNPDDNSNSGSLEEDSARGPYGRWVRELMQETGARALPRNNEVLGRMIDSQEFWKTFELTPIKARLEE